MKKRINLIYKVVAGWSILMTAMVQARGQQATFTQYMDNLIPINHAYSVVQPGGSVFSGVRKQWIGVPGAPTSYLLNVNVPFEDLNASAGIVASNDVFAVEHQTEINFFFAKALKINANQNLAVSLNAGLRNYVANYSNVDATDAVFRNDIRESRPDLGFGVMFYSPSYYLGISLPELSINNLGNASVEDNSNFQNHYYFTGGVTTRIGDQMKMKYSSLVAYSKNIPLIADISATLYLQQVLGIGLTYRTNREAAGILSVKYRSVHLGYSYQFGTTTGNVGGFSNASQEVLLGISFGRGSKSEN